MNTYETFYQLHHQDKPFILANAWNVKSAQIIEENGFASMGTSSGAISNSMGYEDGEKMPFNELLFIVQKITAKVKIPVSVDFERGYTDNLSQLTDNIDKLMEAGVVGINLEDAQGEEIYLRKLTAIKNHLLKTNQNMFINARTDGFLQKLDAPLELTIKRAQQYQDMGADGLFVTGVKDLHDIQTIVSSTKLPVNIVAVPSLYSVKQLATIGVKRISMAVLLYGATYRSLGALTAEITHQNSFDTLG